MYRYLVSSALLIMISLGSIANTSMTTPQMSQIYQLIGSPDWHKRYSGFLLLKNFQVTESTNEFRVYGLISLARIEQKAQLERQPDSDAYSDYTYALFSTIGAIDDPRAIDVLVDRHLIGTGSGVINSLAKYGELAYEKVLKRYENDLVYRPFYFMALTKMVHYLTNSSHIFKIKNIILEKSRSTDGPDRIDAAEALEYFYDPDTIARAKELAETDNLESVRIEARRALIIQMNQLHQDTP